MRRIGWEVEVLVSAYASQRTFRILGVHAQLLDPVIAAHAGPDPDVVVASADLYESNQLLHAYIRDTARHGAEIAFWDGASEPKDTRKATRKVEYRLSRAARVFKQQAIYAAGVETMASTIETFNGRHFRAPTMFQSPGGHTVKLKPSARIEYRSQRVGAAEARSPGS